MKYRIYIDEVENSDLGSSDDPNHRFLSLTGVILELGYVQRTLNPEMESLKAEFFCSHPDEPVVFHRKELLNAKPPFEALRDDAIRRAFDAKLLRLLQAWQYTVAAVCLDKRRHRDSHSEPYEPCEYCLEVLLERFVHFLRRCGGQGDVMAEPRGGREDQRLKSSFVRLWEKGTRFINHSTFSQPLTSRQLKLKTKANNISGLQLADVVAHPSRNEILRENMLLPNEIAPFAQQVIAVLQDKYDRDKNRVFGKKLI